MGLALCRRGTPAVRGYYMRLVRNSCRPLKRTRFAPLPTSALPCRAFPCRHFVAETGFVPPSVRGIEFRNSLPMPPPWTWLRAGTVGAGVRWFCPASSPKIQLSSQSLGLGARMAGRVAVAACRVGIKVKGSGQECPLHTSCSTPGGCRFRSLKSLLWMGSWNPTLRFAQGRLSRKVRETWGTLGPLWKREDGNQSGKSGMGGVFRLG